MNPANDIRELIWEIGNGTSEAALCNTLESFFPILCPFADLLEPYICLDYKHAYQARCSLNGSHKDDVSFFYISFMLILCLGVVSLIRTRQWLFLPESAVLITCGLFTGSLLVSVNKSHTAPHFNPDIFFEILLPFIIFESGYNMEKTRFGKNVKDILLLAVGGTLLSCLAVFGLLRVLTTWDALDCAVFASLISSTDPVAIISVFSSLHIDANLYALVFGESILNDGVSVALYSSFTYFYFHPQEDVEMTVVALNFLQVFLGSLLLGFVFAIACALLWKHYGKLVFTRQDAVLETLVYLLFAVLPYYLSDVLGWSGIITLVSNSIALNLYAHEHLSQTCKFHVVFLVECFARLFESIMFGYLGTQIVVNNERMVWTTHVGVGVVAVFVARALAVFPLLTLRNQTTPRKISVSHQIALWFSGFRGALGFALAVTIPPYDAVLKQGSKHSGEMLATTVLVIVLNVFVMGSLAPTVLRILKVQQGEDDNDEHGEVLLLPSCLQHVHSHMLMPLLVVEEEKEEEVVPSSSFGVELTDSSRRPLLLPERDGFVVIDHHQQQQHDFSFTPRLQMAKTQTMATTPTTPLGEHSFSLLQHNYHHRHEEEENA